MNDGEELNSPEMCITEVGLNISQKKTLFKSEKNSEPIPFLGGGQPKHKIVTNHKLLELELFHLG